MGQKTRQHYQDAAFTFTLEHVTALLSANEQLYEASVNTSLIAGGYQTTEEQWERTWWAPNRRCKLFWNWRKPCERRVRLLWPRRVSEVPWSGENDKRPNCASNNKVSASSSISNE